MSGLFSWSGSSIYPGKDRKVILKQHAGQYQQIYRGGFAPSLFGHLVALLVKLF